MTVDEMRHVFPDYRAKEERIMQDTVTRIVEVFRERGFAIPRATAAECWRQYSYDCQETERLVELRPTDQETYAVVMGYYPGVLAGLEDKDAAAIGPLPDGDAPGCQHEFTLETIPPRCHKCGAHDPCWRPEVAGA